jgi:hypothetical protein
VQPDARVQPTQRNKPFGLVVEFSIPVVLADEGLVIEYGLPVAKIF